MYYVYAMRPGVYTLYIYKYIRFARVMLNKAVRPHPTGSSGDTCNVQNGTARRGANSLVAVVGRSWSRRVPFIIMTRG